MNQQQLTNYAQILDGFTYATSFPNRPFPNSYYWTALANMEDLRICADQYRPRWFVIPDQFQTSAGAGALPPILPGKTFFYNFPIKAGSYLWGLNFASFATSAGSDLNALNWTIQVTETGSNVPLFDRVIAASAMRAPFAGSTFASDRLKQYNPVQVLAEPRLILEPAEIHVELTNNNLTDTASACQLALFFAVPK